jgi:hypothetical protein
MNKKTKEHIQSAIITFVTGFAVVMVTEIDAFTLDSFQDGTLVGAVFVAVRAGFKALLQLAIAWWGGK